MNSRTLRCARGCYCFLRRQHHVFSAKRGAALQSFRFPNVSGILIFRTLHETNNTCTIDVANPMRVVGLHLSSQRNHMQQPPACMTVQVRQETLALTLASKIDGTSTVFKARRNNKVDEAVCRAIHGTRLAPLSKRDMRCLPTAADAVWCMKRSKANPRP